MSSRWFQGALISLKRGTDVESSSLFYNAIVGVVALCGGLLFTWWWLVIGKASDVYHYTTAVLYGIAVASAVNVFVLHTIYHNNVGCPPVAAVDIAGNWWYIFRHAPENIAMFCIVYAMAKRTILILRNSRKKKEPLPEKSRMDVVSTIKVEDPFDDRRAEEEEGR